MTRPRDDDGKSRAVRAAGGSRSGREPGHLQDPREVLARTSQLHVGENLRRHQLSQIRAAKQLTAGGEAAVSPRDEVGGAVRPGHLERIG